MGRIGCISDVDDSASTTRDWNQMMNSQHATSLSDRSSAEIITPSVDESCSVEGNTVTTQKFIRASICLKLTIFVGFLVVLASGIPALVLWLKTHEQLVGEIQRRLLTVSTLRQEQLKEYLESERDKAGLIANRVLINNFLTHKLNANDKKSAEYDLGLAVSVISDFVFAAVYNAQGSFVLSAGESWGQYVQQTVNVWLVERSEELILGHPQLTPKGWMYNMSHAIYNNSTFIGVLLTWVNATKLGELVYDRTGLQQTGELLIGIQENESSDTIDLLLPALQDKNVTRLRSDGAMARAMAGESGVLRQRDYSGASIIAAYTPVKFKNWGLVAKLDVREAYAPIQSVRIVIITTIVVLVAVGVTASLGLAKIFTKPIIELGRAAVSLGEGHMRTRARKGKFILRDEIADLMDTFNSMAHRIASNQSILEHKVKERTVDLARANDGLATEIEERRRIEVELQKAKDAADAANRSKSEFLANMSHEIRTPLNAIINFTELCLDSQITAEQKEYLDYVCFASQHLLRLITDILDFSKIEAGKLEIEEVQFSLYDQLEHAVSVLATRALQSGLELCCCIAPDVPDQLKGDPGRLLQIFVNLIGNAIKFTEKGEVVVFASVENRSADSVEMKFGVKDTGLGIPPEKQSLLFKAFSQVDSSTHRLYGGTGLGLVISAKLASAMGGMMWVESSGIPGQGSTFLFRAKFGTAETSSSSSPIHVYSFKEAKALVVDDNDTSCRMLAGLLEGFGMVVDCVKTVEEAESALIAASQSGARFNVVLLDMQLDGTSAVNLIHFLQREPAHVVRYSSTSIAGETRPLEGCSASAQSCVLDCVIMLTSVNSIDTARCKELGVSCHTSKPIKRSLLVRSLHEALGIRDETGLQEKKVEVEDVPSKNLHILVAEDNLVNQRVASILLKKWGHTFVIANNGEEAVEQWRRSDFDMVLMDVQMPVCDGFQATRRIRDLETSEKRKHTPIVAMTAHAMCGDGDRCIALGMDFYISKPLKAKKLQGLIQVIGMQGPYTNPSIW